MEVTDGFVDRQTVRKRISRSKFHYKPISSAELLLTIVLSTFVGFGLFIAAVVNTQPKNANSQMQLSTTEQYFNLADTNSSSDV